jgi:hypothetical protein
MSQSDEHGHAAMRAAIDGLEKELGQANATLQGYSSSTNAAARDLVKLVDDVKPLLLRAHAALMVDERNKPLLDELIEATLDMEDCRARWAKVASGA